MYNTYDKYYIGIGNVEYVKFEHKLYMFIELWNFSAKFLIMYVGEVKQMA